ncbi:hypothetical protein Tco_1285489 [Tanacetum coccineum]
MQVSRITLMSLPTKQLFVTIIMIVHESGDAVCVMLVKRTNGKQQNKEERNGQEKEVGDFNKEDDAQEISDEFMGERTFFLGLPSKAEKMMDLHQQKYVARYMKSLILHCETASTQLEYNQGIVKDEEAVKCGFSAVVTIGVINADVNSLIGKQFLAYRFLASSVHYALTVSPTIYASYIEQFWNTAHSQIVNDVKQIHATVDARNNSVPIPNVADEAVFRSGMMVVGSCLGIHNQDDAQDLVIRKLKKKVRKLEKKLRARTPGMKLFKIGTSKRKSLDEEYVSKQGRKVIKKSHKFVIVTLLSLMLEHTMENIEVLLKLREEYN